MTTIATDGKTIAADGQITAGDIISDMKCRKVFKLSNGRALGVAGTLSSCDAFRAWFADPSQPQPDLSDDFKAVIIDGTDRVTVYDGQFYPICLPVPYTIGSGREVALGAMLTGATPKQAVKAAISVDVYSGGTVREVKL